MTQKELIQQVVANLKASDKKAKQFSIETVVKTTFKTIMDSVVNGEQVRINDFALIHTSTRRAQRYRKPTTGEWVVLPEKRFVSIRFVARFKKRVENAVAQRGQDV